MASDATTHELSAQRDHRQSPSLVLAVVLTAMAGGMGWGIRGQYGHETGAMIAGVLVGLVLVFLFYTRSTSLSAARAVALCALGVSIGGSMTYGQTVGLTHDAALIGNWQALRWGLLGLFLKGGIWIAFAAALLGMALSDRRYRPLEMSLLLLVMVFAYFLGFYLFNTPFDPAGKALPTIYFSDHWFWERDAELKPRLERWGGLLAALAVLTLYARCVRRDRLAARLAFWGFLAGGVGFSLGQSVQAFHAWNVEMFQQGWFGAKIEPHMNWWNMMETTFGATFGAILALGLWLNRHLIGPGEDADEVELPIGAEWLLVGVHVAALTMWNFGSFAALDLFADLALTMVIIPIVAVAGGRLWPYLVTLPIVALPIAGKTFRQLCVVEEQVSTVTGALVYLVLPLCVTLAAALVLARNPTKPLGGRSFARWSLLLCTWLYFWLNFAFFHFPWPWQPWTGRTPSGIIFSVCAVGLTAAALLYGRRTDSGIPEADGPALES